MRAIRITLYVDAQAFDCHNCKYLDVGFRGDSCDLFGSQRVDSGRRLPECLEAEQSVDQPAPTETTLTHDCTWDRTYHQDCAACVATGRCHRHYGMHQCALIAAHPGECLTEAETPPQVAPRGTPATWDPEGGRPINPDPSEQFRETPAPEHVFHSEGAHSYCDNCGLNWCVRDAILCRFTKEVVK